MAVGSQGHPIHLLLSLTSPETGYPPHSTPVSHAWVQALVEPGGLSQSQVLLDLQACGWCPPAFPSSCPASVRNAEDPSPVSHQCLTCWIRTPCNDSGPCFWWLMLGTPFLLGSSSSLVLPNCSARQLQNWRPDVLLTPAEQVVAAFYLYSSVSFKSQLNFFLFNLCSYMIKKYNPCRHRSCSLQNWFSWRKSGWGTVQFLLVFFSLSWDQIK